ncbi:hypothetical protein H5410_040106, partial [Solanum commersonii]
DPSLPERKTNEHIDISTPFMGVNAEGVKDLNRDEYIEVLTASLQVKKADEHVEVSTPLRGVNQEINMFSYSSCLLLGDPSLQEKKANEHIEVSTLFGM